MQDKCEHRIGFTNSSQALFNRAINNVEKHVLKPVLLNSTYFYLFLLISTYNLVTSSYVLNNFLIAT